MHIYIKAVALFAISDKISRKSPFQFGALVGTTKKADIIVTDALDLRASDAGDVDFNYLDKRLSLLLAVSPNAQLVGLYCTEDSDFDGILHQFHNKYIAVPHVCLVLGEEVNQLKCFDSTSRERLAVTIRPGETEEIATASVHNHPNYSEEEPELAQNNEESLLLSLEQLERHTRKILDSPVSTSEIDRGMVYLANLVASYKQDSTPENYELLTSHLCLLTNELAAINGWKNQFSRRLLSLLARTYYKPN